MTRLILLLLGISGSALADEVTLPAQFHLYHYDELSVQALNQGVSKSITVDTNRLWLQKFSRQVKIEEFPFGRIEREMQQPGVRCTMDRIKTPERIERYLFSLPVNFYLGYRLYQRADVPALSAPLLNAKGELQQLTELFQQQPSSRLLVSDHYSLGEYLDAEIAKVDPSQKLRVATTQYYQQFLGVFLAKRAEYAVLYPTAIQEHFHTGLPMQVRSYPIAGSPAYVTGHLMCNRTPESAKFIQQVDQVLLQLYQDQDFFEAHRRYMVPEDAVVAAELIRTFQQAGLETSNSFF